MLESCCLLFGASRWVSEYQIEKTIEDRDREVRVRVRVRVSEAHDHAHHLLVK